MTPRRYLTAKRKAALWHDQDERWNHILPLCLGGDTCFADWQGLGERGHADVLLELANQ